MSANIPFSEPPWLDGLPSPYYSDSHREWQKYCREWINEHFTQHAMEWEREEAVPEHIYGEFAKDNMLVPNLAPPLPVKHLKAQGIHQIGPLKVEDFDYIHAGIYIAEMRRSGLNGPASAICAGMAFGLPPILKFGDKQLQDKVLPDLLTGKKRICIAITEPEAGSDVANVATRADKSKDGKYYIVNGTKKWITNGLWSDWASMCVRTGGKGPGGLSVLLVPLKNHPGVKMRPIKLSGQHSAGTTFIELEDVKVPVENLLGEEGKGMKYIMTNFNHERLTVAIGATVRARVALAAAMAYCMKREAFGMTLMDQPVVRYRLAHAGAELETQWAWVEQFIYQMVHLDKETADTRLGGMTAMAKAKAGLVFKTCAECAQILFGGNGYTATGQGELIERITREVAGSRIPGGSEDVMMDLAIRQLVKNYQRETKKLSESQARL